MRVDQLKIEFLNNLKEAYPSTEASSFFYWLMEDYLQMDRLQIALHPQMELNAAQLKKFERAKERLLQQEPIQYIIGKTSFYGLDFNVDLAVLIPRPETEELVDWILKETNPTAEISILDIGTGSGCIAISLAKNLPCANIFALDISKEALKMATENARLNETSIGFFQMDILAVEKLPQKVDIIVSNPPYVREMEKSEMHGNVLDHEPESALYVKDDDALVFYRKIAQLAEKNLSKNGLVYLEINQYLGKETEEVFQKEGLSTELRKDIFGNDRMIKAYFKNN